MNILVLNCGSSSLKYQIINMDTKDVICKGLCEQQGTFSTVRGIWQTFGKIPVMPTFHPAYVLRVPSVKRTVWQDLQAVLARLGRPVPPVRAAAPTAKG